MSEERTRWQRPGCVAIIRLTARQTPPTTHMNIDPSSFNPDARTVTLAGAVCTLRHQTYANGRHAIDLSTPDNDLRVTVNLPEVDLADNEVLIKDYAENEGVLAALVAAGVVHPTDRLVQSGFVALPVCEFLPPGGPGEFPRKYESVSQPGVFFWAEEDRLGGATPSFGVVAQAGGFPATAAHDDCFTRFKDADEVARALAQE